MRQKVPGLLAALAALCMALALLPGTAFAVESTTANLTPEIASAYLDTVESLFREYGAPVRTQISWDDATAYCGMCGGYVADLGDGGSPEMIVAYAKESYYYSVQNLTSYIRVYTWNGKQAVLAFEEQVLASGNGRAWPAYFLCRSGDTAWLDCQWESLPSYDYVSGEVYGGDTEITHFRMENGAMKQFAPQTEAASTARLGIFDYITFNNYNELKASLTNAADSALSGYDSRSALSVTVGGEAVMWTGVIPFIDENGRTMAPLRAVAYAMGLDVNWDAAAREAAFTDGSKTICFPIDSTTARTSDGGTVRMDTAAVIVSGRTYAPVRYLAEYFDYEVGWDASTNTVIIK